MQELETLDRNNIEKLVEKTGGPFELTVLIQKRIKELKSGQPKLVDFKSTSLLEIACQEIIEGKIELVKEEEPVEEKIVQKDVEDIFAAPSKSETVIDDNPFSS